MKSYTNIEQSQKLAEILPIESADMYYCYGMNIDTKIWSFDDTPTIIDADNQVDVDDIPCWSLAALLNVLPKNLDIGRPVLATNYRGYYWVSYFDEYMKETNLISKIYNNPIDACYEMIIKLNELKML